MNPRNRLNPFDSHLSARLRVTAVAVLVVVLAGCGGGGGGDAPAPQTPTPAPSGSTGSAGLADVITCVVGAVLFGGCPASGASVTTVSDSDCYALLEFCDDPVTLAPDVRTDTSTTPPVIVWPYELPVLDVEPNDGSAPPAVAAMAPIDSPLGELGFETNGTLVSATDVMDNYIFTAPWALEVTIQLCERRDTLCDQMTADASLGIDIAYLRLLDANGAELARTESDHINGNIIALQIDGGVPYTLSVAGGYWAHHSDPFAPQSVDYYLRVIGTEPAEPALPAEPVPSRPAAPQLTMSASSTMIATLDWIAPSLNTDSTALVDLQGYVLYYGDAEGGPYAFQQPLDLGLSSYTLPLPDYGTWYFAITAINAAGVESDFSNEVLLLDPPPVLP